MSALGSVIGQPLASDLSRLTFGSIDMLSGSLGLLKGAVMRDGTAGPSASQWASGAKDAVTASVGLAARLVSTAGWTTTKLADGMAWALDTVASSAKENPLLVTPGNILSGTSTALKVTAGLVDTVTGHPLKAYDLVMGHTSPGVTPEKRTQAADALQALLNDPRVNDNMKAVIRELAAMGTGAHGPDFVADMLSGAHVVIQDGGARYGQWNATPDLGVAHRDSSHYSSGEGIMAKLNGAVRDPLHSGAEQRGFDVPGLGHILFGTCLTAPGAATTNTWFQFEAHGTSARESIPHGADWVLHKASGNAQVGPLGYAARTEKPNALGQTSHYVIPNPD